ncbi:TPA: hypothetical protein N0F65_007314 [Lagenidium giganteum]|uniref:Tyrosine specific protein phosphatases domain-containing protein n=1 Tax=Lagenidium giganteum TaxID=4803 RepID=A0AAV2Z418_9STRA|nr:TPA: hypothetical protein N0F65_007314 [Lagenidium giganteum]
MSRVQRYRGCLALALNIADDTSTSTTELQQMVKHGSALHHFTASPADEWHITLVTKAEMHQLDAAVLAEAESAVGTKWYPIGVGGHGAAFFVVCVWPKAQAFRAKHGLPIKDFHVTVTLANSHSVSKWFGDVLDKEAAIESLRMEALEALSRELLLEHKHDDAKAVATHLCATYGADTRRGWLRLAEAASELHQHKLAMLSYGYLLMTSIDVDDADAQAQCLVRLVKCAQFTEWGHAFEEAEVNQIPSRLEMALLTLWPQATWAKIQTATESLGASMALTMEPREKLRVLATGATSARFYKLPRFFRWVVPFHLAAMSTPRNTEDIVHLAKSLGIRHIVTLTKEEPLQTEWFANVPSITNTFLPVTNYRAPSNEQIDLFLRLCMSARDVPVLVHCGGGKGRAGTLLACYLVAFGMRTPVPEDEWTVPAMTPADAIALLRTIRPGSIETEEQEKAVSKYSSLLWKRQAVLPPPVDEAVPSKPVVQGGADGLTSTDLLVLCGLPGSGKTSFRKMLLKRETLAPAKTRVLWTVFSGDDHGRAACERGISGRGIRKAILDRCNGRPKGRKLFLELASTWSKHATAVWFDFSKGLCRYRAQQRSDHPTLPAGGGRISSAINQHASDFTPPSLEEGFKNVVHITSIEAAHELAELLSPPVELYKFPRTGHLFNMGAATQDDLIDQPMDLPQLRSEDVQIVLTEKVDGANMGISLDANGGFIVQNRSHYVTSKSHTQFRKLDWFLDEHRNELFELLHRDPLYPERYILFGEWLAATHSIPYTALGKIFYAFDIYDRQSETFWDRHAVENALVATSIPIVPKVWSGNYLPDQQTLKEYAYMPSPFYDGPREGVYVKWEAFGRVLHRSKVVRHNFITGNDHWTKDTIRFNRVLPPTEAVA